ncbi:MAG: hypothetical protein ABSD70_08575 [Terracidiphilus sp.]|jgi:cytochrome c553
MKRTFAIIIVLMAAAGFAAAQNYSPSTDVLGAHLNYGRGCAACHAPHSGAYGNGNAKTADPTSGNVALWGEDVASLYGKTIATGGGTYSETLPSTMSTASEAFGLLTCLSCHDGNFAEGAMMKNAVYETLPSTYGTWNAIPTLLGADGTTTGNYLNDHPVGALATFGCNTSKTQTGFIESGYNWDCTISGTTITAGPSMTKFINNYGFFVSLGTSTSATAPIVVCTTCHNQHLMNVVKVTQTAGLAAAGGATVSAGLSGITPGTYQTMFFLRGPYDPMNTSSTSNSAAQFCRQCHGGESNEMNNGTAVTTF